MVPETLLLVALCSALFVLPCLEGTWLGAPFLGLSLVSALAAFLLRAERGRRLVGALAVVGLLARLCHVATGAPITSWAALVTGLGVVAYAAYEVLDRVMAASKVSKVVLLNALSIYLLVALGFAFAFGCLELAVPGSFSLGPEPLRSGIDMHVLGRFGYFSLVTVTTLGYGDLSPVTGPARALASAEALLGQVYLAVLVARLVSRYGGGPEGSSGEDAEHGAPQVREVLVSVGELVRGARQQPEQVALLERADDGGAQSSRLPGLLEVLVEADLVDRLDRGFLVRVARQQDAGHVRLAGAGAPKQLDPVDPRHHEVADHDVDVVTLEVGEGVLGRLEGGRLDLELDLEQAAQTVEDHRLVVDDEDLRGGDVFVGELGPLHDAVPAREAIGSAEQRKEHARASICASRGLE